MALPNPYDTTDCDPALMRDEQLLETLETPEYWHKVCPHLTVCQTDKGQAPRAHEKEILSAKRLEFVQNGFFHMNRQDLNIQSDQQLDKLAAGVVRLMQYGWPASFIFIYDEAWEVIKNAQDNIRQATGGSQFIGDMYAWYVDPARGERGWGPHRDRMGSGPKSFRSDGTAMLSTTWLALTEAGPNNSCVYVIPRHEDPWYDKQDLPEVDPLAAVFEGNPGAFQAIRALACPKGAAWHFSHKIIHWGSHVKNYSTMGPGISPPCPRIAMSWVVGDETFEQPAFSRDLLPYPPIKARVGFVAGQMIAYGGQTGLKKGFKTLCYRLLKRNKELFSEFFADKVEYIFYCRPAPRGDVPVKKKEPVDISKLEFATEKDDAKLNGLLGMFGADSSSSEEEDDE
mmetsp:Transcript_23882/g.38075  ORF Transcript_23882/g.38075 Transcript_23882/m.38075 type:complete len:398 (-) Transcript_23882:1229-2422(-)|eukprot:CAMPEP_0203745292 /NCGR_PEP_ID=MMETSP0098-20131031/1078_1 /ASSEMBLY_ACC=CAM_ASM_000208 /TAXON_ID=96639 /ORGANISM=" , Strain NY0313808BC1" /LENGTH=397 /DNA_ID=CAMNT_0050633031 /DNA_START=3121 /DNA_END=4314 /DNA_ORIENTATION=-